MIYVDTLSTEIMELGTPEFPYKHLDLVFIELFNLYSLGGNTEVEVFLSESG